MADLIATVADVLDRTPRLKDLGVVGVELLEDLGYGMVHGVGRV
jgi:hypothetical protein